MLFRFRGQGFGGFGDRFRDVSDVSGTDTKIGLAFGREGGVVPMDIGMPRIGRVVIPGMPHPQPSPGVSVWQASPSAGIAARTCCWRMRTGGGTWDWAFSSGPLARPQAQADEEDAHAGRQAKEEVRVLVSVPEIPEIPGYERDILGNRRLLTRKELPVIPLSSREL